MTSRIDYVIKPAARLDAAARAERSRDATFGRVFTEHMVTLRWNEESGWHDGRVEPLAPLSIDPATVGLHYGQIVFEGLKAYRLADGGIGVFRPDRYAERFQRSAARLMMPQLPTEEFVGAIEHLIRLDADWVPREADRSLYLRPLLFAADADLALRPSRNYTFVLMAFVTEMFFGAKRAIDVWLCEDYVRAAPGGVGAAKYAGNYAVTYAAQAQAAEEGCDQVVWLDARERRWVEELGGMNLLFVEEQDGRLVTPPLAGTILPGVTRQSILELAGTVGLTAVERPISVDEWEEGCRTGRITEVFACGTAAQITSVGRVRGRDREWLIGDGSPGPVAERLGALLAGIHRGTERAPGDWVHRVGGPDADIGETVTLIWREVLAIPVDADSDFFESGGHSVAVLQVINRIQERFGTELSVRDLFENSVLGDFIDVVRTRVDG
ncbi:branched-chain amino acid aminotransferase [Micromonospora sp. CPCC 205561]